MRNILILASGSGSNAAALVEYVKTKMPGTRIAVGCNRTPEKAGVYAKMEKLKVDTHYLPSPGMDFSAMRNFLANSDVGFDLILLAGYMRILPDDIVEKHNIINIHPSILPFVYKGSENAYKDALDNGDLKTGCTVHRVTPDVDGGQILAQIGFEIPDKVLADYDLDTLKAIGLAHEHALYPLVMRNLLQNNRKDFSINMSTVQFIAGQLLKSRGLNIVMKNYQTIIPSTDKENPSVFKSWNAKVR